MTTSICTIEEHQQYIEDVDQRKAKIQFLLQELSQHCEFDEEEYEFEPDAYQGDDASDFLFNLPDDFVYGHIDDLLACGVTPRDIDVFMGSGGLHDTADFL